MMIAMRFQAVLFLCLTLGAVAWAAAPEEWFVKGRDAFARKDYRQAAEAFERARRGGLASPALDYNLGVTYYRLGRYSEAERAFGRLLGNPAWAALAHYNLGLVAVKRGRDAEARRRFLAAKRHAREPKLRRLAVDMLRRLPGKKRAWTGFFSAGIGYDSNVTLVNPALSGVGESDSFLDLFAGAGKRVRGDHRNGLRVHGSIYTTRYASQNDFDIGQLRAGFVLDRRLGEVQGEGGMDLSETYFGGTPFLRVVSMRFAGRYRVGRGHRLKLLYQPAYIKATDDTYGYLTGSRHRLRIQDSRRTRDGKRWLLSYTLELNDRRDQRTGSTFSSYSATRHAVRGTVTLPAGPRTRLVLDLKYRYSRYNDPSVQSGGTVVRRVDKYARAAARLRYALDERWSLRGEYRYTRNRSTLDVYTYNQGIFLVGIGADF